MSRSVIVALISTLVVLLGCRESREVGKGFSSQLSTADSLRLVGVASRALDSAAQLPGAQAYEVVCFGQSRGGMTMILIPSTSDSTEVHDGGGIVFVSTEGRATVMRGF